MSSKLQTQSTNRPPRVKRWVNANDWFNAYAIAYQGTDAPVPCCQRHVNDMLRRTRNGGAA